MIYYHNFYQDTNYLSSYYFEQSYKIPQNKTYSVKKEVKMKGSINRRRKRKMKI